MEKDNNIGSINIDESMQDSFYLFKKVSLMDKSNFFDYIGMMLEGGVTIGEALNSVSNKIKNQFFVSKINELKMYISSGDSFSKSMKKIPMIFSTPEIAMVESGEVTGDLGKTFLKLSEDIKKIHNLQLKIKGALTYPLIIFLFLITAVIIVLTYVIPAILPVFETSGVELPFATVLLIGVSNFIRNNAISLIILISSLIIGLKLYKNTQKGKEVISNFILKFPLIGSIYKNYILSVFASNLGTLISSGITIINSLKLTSKSVNNVDYERIIIEIADRVSKGSKITEAMQEVDKTGFYFTPDFIQLFSVGEKTASIDVVTKKISNQYSLEVDNSLGSLTKWIEPIAILIAGLFVVWFAFAIFGAILKVTQTVS